MDGIINIREGSKKVPLRTKAITCKCGVSEHRLNNKYNTSVVGAVSTRKPTQVRNLEVVKEGLNMLLDAGDLANKHKFNELWFSTTAKSGIKQGKGKKYWCQPVKRWNKLLDGE